ncbi:unnamed protein product [Camellia sinensis]
MSANAADSETQNGTTELQPHPPVTDYAESDLRPDDSSSSSSPSKDNAPSPPPPTDVDVDSKLDEPSHKPIQSNDVPVTNADPNLHESQDQSIVESNGTENENASSSVVEEAKQQQQPELRKEDEGSRTFTMRELLNELKNGDEEANDDSEDAADRQDANSPYSRESTQQQQHVDQNNASMELINSVTGADEEGSVSGNGFLHLLPGVYASALERNPEDYDALYNWALVLQESADNVSPDSSSPSKDDLLEEACKKYDEATHLCPTLHDAYYNWAIAISDRAKMRGRTKEAEELWKQATKNYEKAVQLNWNSPQALNNWGLALQELSAIVPAREKQAIVKTAINKFRAAIQLQFDFHRAIYNLGTVLYGLAEDTSRTGGSVNVKEVSSNELFSQSAIYIAAAHALKPTYSVYASALKLVRSMLNKAEQKQMSQSLSGNSGDTMSSNRLVIKVDVPDIVSVSACADLTLPRGAGLCIDTIHGPVFLIADSWESLDGWLDAIRLVYTIFARGKSDVMAALLGPVMMIYMFV